MKLVGRKQEIATLINTGKLIEKHNPVRYAGKNILYDEYSDMSYITTYGKIKAFRLRR